MRVWQLHSEYAIRLSNRIILVFCRTIVLSFEALHRIAFIIWTNFPFILFKFFPVVNIINR